VCKYKVKDKRQKRERVFMVLKFLVFFIVPALIVGFTGLKVFAAKTNGMLYDFEESAEGWKVPDWAFYQTDHVAREVKVSGEKVLKGKGSLEIVCDFPGDRWSAALVEVEKDMDLSEYEIISADIYIPRDAPKGFFRARFIMTVGIGWHFIEQREPVSLVPGKWVTVKAPLEKSELGVSAWKGRGEKRLFRHINAVKKIAIRVEYDAAPPHVIGPRYHGPVYIDSVLVEK